MPQIITGVSGVNRKAKKIPIGVSGVNRETKTAWTGVGGINRKVFSGEITYNASCYVKYRYSISGAVSALSINAGDSANQDLQVAFTFSEALTFNSSSKVVVTLTQTESGDPDPILQFVSGAASTSRYILSRGTNTKTMVFTGSATLNSLTMVFNGDTYSGESANISIGTGNLILYPQEYPNGIAINFSNIPYSEQYATCNFSGTINKL